MSGFTQTIVVGNVGRDAERIQSANTYGVKFSVAVTKKYKDRSGQMQEKTKWFECIKWANDYNKNVVDLLLTAVKKGMQMTVIGEVDTSAWTGKEDGLAKSKLTVNIDNFVLPGKGNHSGEGEYDPFAGDADPEDDPLGNM